MTRALKTRGFLLVFALMLTVLITVIGFGMLSAHKGNYATSRGALESILARNLARSGIEDARVKLTRYPFFPSGVGDEQKVFSYSERVVDFDGGDVGSYQVVVDRSFRDTHQIIRVESTGIVGQTGPNSARHTLYGELYTQEGNFVFRIWQEGSLPRL
jgi:hypothetical protein